MNVHEYRFLLTERHELRNMLAHVPESAILDRMSLQDRLQEVEAELEAYDGYSPHIMSVNLTFRGEPVFGSSGIQADFGLDAAKGFVQSVRLVGASFHGVLHSVGRVSNADDYSLMITGTAVGSYGFKIEPLSQQPAFEGERAPVEVAISRVKDVLKASVASDEDLMEAIDGVDIRALTGLSNFLKTVADGGAVCSLSLGEEVFSFDDVDQIRRSQNRLSSDIIEEEVTMAGKFKGFFPLQPRGQFEIARVDSNFGERESGRVVVAKVDQAVADAININTLLEQEVEVRARARRVGSGRPRYVITQLSSRPDSTGTDSNTQNPLI